MQPANFQSTIFSFTCANIRTSVQSGQVGGTEGAIGLLTVSRQQDVAQMPIERERDAAQCGLISSGSSSLSTDSSARMEMEYCSLWGNIVEIMELS